MKIRLSALSAAIVATLVLMGCKEIQIVDGKIPAGYADAVKPYLGSYSGKFAKVKGTLTISVVDDKPIATFVANNGDQDFLGGCNSSVGDLETVRIKQTSNSTAKLQEAIFKFDPGQCTDVQGRELILSFEQSPDGHLMVIANILSETDYYIPSFPYDPGFRQFYFKGRFIKQ